MLKKNLSILLQYVICMFYKKNEICMLFNFLCDFWQTKLGSVDAHGRHQNTIKYYLFIQFNYT